jgi:hypothetical protein
MPLPTNPYHDFSRAELYAFVYKRWGEAGLKQVLDGPPPHLKDRYPINPNFPVTRELDEDAMHELRLMGLNHIANIIEPYTAKLPSEYDPGHGRHGKKEADKLEYPWRTALRDSPPA